jgi:hypothetical protein
MEEQERINLIKNAVLASQGFTNKAVESFVEEVKTEQVIGENGLFGISKSDIQDEVQFLGTDVAEEIDEEDQETEVSDQMKGVYK